MCSCKCLVKLLLVLINLIFLFAGLLMLAFGIVAKVKPDSILNFFRLIPGMDHVPKAFDLQGIVLGSAIFMIVLGALVAIIGFFGFFGACCENKCMIITYVVFLVLILGAEIALIIYAAVFPDKFQGPVQDLMNKSLQQIKNDIWVNSSSVILPNDDVSLGWAVLQLEAQCCGAYNSSDYFWWNRNATINGETFDQVVPMSCCSTNQKVDLFLEGASYNMSIFTNIDACVEGNINYINTQNCYQTVNMLIQHYRTIAIGIAAGICGIELILILLAICLCRHSNEKEI